MISLRRAGAVSVLMGFLAVLCVASPAMGATWVVNPDGTGDFTTIQAAVDSNWTSGDTIQVEYAVYREMVSVEAEGKTLAIVGVLSAEDEKPVIDGMGIVGTDSTGGAVDPYALYDTGDAVLSDGSMYDSCLGLYNGSFAVSSLCLRNSSGFGLEACSGSLPASFSATGIEVAENTMAGMYVQWFSDTSLAGAGAYDNGDYGVIVYGDEVALSGVTSSGNGWNNPVDNDGVYVYSDGLLLDDVVSTGNSGSGIHISLRYGDLTNAADMQSTTATEESVCAVTGVLAADNGNDGIQVHELGNHPVAISGIESTGNGGNGLYLYGLQGFALSELLAAENGYSALSPPAQTAGAGVREDSTGFDEMPVSIGPGIGIAVLDSVNGSIEYTESVNNSAAGVVLENTVSITLRHVGAAEHSAISGIASESLPSGVYGAGISESGTYGTLLEDCLAYNNWVDYFYGGMPSLPDEDHGYSVSGVYPTVRKLWISDPSDENTVPTILSWMSECDVLMVGQPFGPVTDFSLPPRYHDAGGIYAEVLGVSGGTIELEFVIPEEFPPMTAEGLTVWNLEWSGEDYGWVRPTGTYNTLVGGERHVGVTYIFPDPVFPTADLCSSFSLPVLTCTSLSSVMDSGPDDSFETMFAPFWYESPGGDDAGGDVLNKSASGLTPAAGNSAGNATVTPMPVPAEPAAEEKDNLDAPVTMTPAPVTGYASPTVPVAQMPADSGGPGGVPFIWIILIVVLAVVAGGVCYMKFQQK